MSAAPVGHGPSRPAGAGRRPACRCRGDEPAVGLQLFISVKTVHYHLTHVCSKLGVRSRSALSATFKSSDA
ncbi:LuxR C-terminal-related transcriptional regulator [Streptomyces tauricus]